MLAVYRTLVRLYPAEHRQIFGEEMLAVLAEEGSQASARSLTARIRLLAREASGLIVGAAREHFRMLLEIRDGLSLQSGRFEMRNGFRFPKSTILFMTLILAGVILAIKRGEDIALSLSRMHPEAGPTQPHSTVPPIAIFIGLFYVFGVVGGAILVALRRSGVDRLADISREQK
jgi:hypothetical protein